MFNTRSIDNTWTLFIDRDGVINHEKENNYINTREEFVFYEGVQKAFEIFAKKFHRIIVTTNQRGVGRGLTTEDNLRLIHDHMLLEIKKSNGRVDAVYYCTDVEDNAGRRKPNPAMGLEAARDFPDIDLKKAVMIGNRLSDMQFGRNLGIHTIYISTTHPAEASGSPLIDGAYPTLYNFAQTL